MLQLAELQKIDNLLVTIKRPRGVNSFASLEAKRSKIEKKIELRTLRYYRRIRERYDNAVVNVHEGYCPGCGIQIPLLIQQEIRRGNSLHSCGTCGRIMLWEAAL